ncbi:MAG TPA: pyridoxamine 5'-phosphate oxidase family protein, partial [Polyangiales bacterium]|nr:pyridoxamine 5'-phosphate oxidase family protein [Polyangiales bacterium]
EQLPFLVVGSLDSQRRPWVSLLFGDPGFVRASSKRLNVAYRALTDDPWLTNVQLGAPVGVLGIELATRRRNRVNGRVRALGGHSFQLQVDQAFGNCKQYIQARSETEARREPTQQRAPQLEGALLSARAVELLSRTDTTFIATASAQPELGGEEGLDVSHRGGRPGFIDVTQGARSTLLLPDFYGNFMFNTFGNLEVNPRAGFVACDFENGDVLSLTGTARVLWDDARLLEFQGAERFFEFEVAEGRLFEGALGQGWSAAEFSPQLEDTGTWISTSG